MSHKYLCPDVIHSKSYIKSFDEYKALYRQSLNSPNEFWEKYSKNFHWKKYPLFHASWNFDINKGPIHIKWFEGGLFNVCYNVLDDHVIKGYGNDVAFHWVPNDAEEDHIKLTYKELLTEVCKFSKVLLNKGIEKGNKVCIYMPMILNLPITMLACARIGAIHSVVFAGYSAEALADRLKDANIDVIVTADGSFRGTKLINLKPIVDEAIDIVSQSGLNVRSCIVVKHISPTNVKHVPPARHIDRFSNHSSSIKSDKSQHLTTNNINNHFSHPNGSSTGSTTTTTINNNSQRSKSPTGPKRPLSQHQIPWDEKIDSWWDDEMAQIEDINNDGFYVEPEWMDPEEPLFMLYTSGSTGTPKGVLHTCAGYLMYAATTFKYVFDYHPGQVYFCSADIGWITGHSYLVYGPLANRATGIIFEGIPTFPKPDRYWEIIARYGVSKFYTSPTAIRALMKFGVEPVKRHDLSSLEILGTVGETINPEAWLWYYEVVGAKKCVVVDTYWQTETGGHVLTPLPGAVPTKPGSAAMPFFGIEPIILDEDGKEITDEREGFLCFKRAWPGIMRTVYNCQERFEKGYFHKFPGYYTTGDGAHRDSDGYYWISGRIDDLMNVSGHLLSTAAVESALQKDPSVAECAVVAVPHAIKGQCLYCYVTMKNGFDYSDNMVKELKEMIADKIGRFAIPDYIQNTDSLPKTRSGKIMRRILRGIAQGISKSKLGDTSTLADETIVDQLIEGRLNK